MFEDRVPVGVEGDGYAEILQETLDQHEVAVDIFPRLTTISPACALPQQNRYPKQVVASNKMLPESRIYVMTLGRTNESINKAEDDGDQLSHVSWLGSSGGNRQAGLIVVNQRHRVIPGQRHISACLSRQRAIVFDRTRLTVFALRRVHVALFFLVEPASMQLPTLRTDQSVSLVDEAARAHQSVFLNEPQW